MAQPSSLPDTIRRWERWTDVAHRYFLPAASAAGLGIASALALGGPRSIGLSAPWALAALGGAALATTLGYHRWREHVARSAAASTSRTRPPPPPPTPIHAKLDAEREWKELVHRAWHTAVPLPAVATPPSVPPLRPAGDELWSHWQPGVVGELPVALVGPVPETAWFPTAPGEIPAFPDKEPGFIVLHGEIVPLPEGMPPKQPLEEPVAEPHRSAKGTELILDPLPAGCEISWPGAPGLGGASGTDDGISIGSGLDPMMFEALHPLPPYLRAGANSAEVLSPVPEMGSTALDLDPSSMCSSCSRFVPDPEEWQPCPECGGPVCRSCRSQAVVYYGHTWCASCAVGREWDHPMVVENPERFPAVFGPAAERIPSYRVGS
ncbi:MAG: hypothetical protein L3K16_03625 [Thermoplasmata archaeon]|nr:hypothetical protein [Thermoplasmata archaeon]